MRIPSAAACAFTPQELEFKKVGDRFLNNKIIKKHVNNPDEWINIKFEQVFGLDMTNFRALKLDKGRLKTFSDELDFLVNRVKKDKGISGIAKWLYTSQAKGRVSPEYMKLKDNFIVLKKSKPLFISRGIYKTNKKYGIIKTKLEDKLILKILEKHLEKMTDNIVFKDANGNQMNSKSISKKINRITEKELGVPLGTSSIAKISIEEINKNPQALEKLKKLGQSRGTSINVLLSAYFNNYKG